MIPRLLRFVLLIKCITSYEILEPQEPPNDDTYWNTWKAPVSSTRWRTQDNQVIYKNQTFNTRGISFNGIEADCRAPLGLFDKPLSFFLDTTDSVGINAIRIPVSYEVMNDLSLPINCVDGEPSLWSGMPVENLIQFLLDKLDERKIKAVFDLHTIGGVITPYPWTNSVSENQVVDAWLRFLRRFGMHNAIMGIEIKNEPHEPCTMTEFLNHCAKVIFNVGKYVPEYEGLFFISGVQIQSPWGGAFDRKGLTSVKGLKHPTLLCGPSVGDNVDRYVLSPHTYGTDVRGEGVQYEGPDTWERFYGFVTTLPNHWNATPVINTEYGGFMREGSSDRDYFERWMSWTIQKGFKSGGFLWTLAPFSGDTGGLLSPSYEIDAYKADFLARLTPNPTYVS